MKVICVKDFHHSEHICTAINTPEIGDEDVVIYSFEDSGIIWHTLVRFGDDIAFRAEYFATLPSLTAEEMNEREREAILI